jgi:hypothetical protein
MSGKSPQITTTPEEVEWKADFSRLFKFLQEQTIKMTAPDSNSVIKTLPPLVPSPEATVSAVHNLDASGANKQNAPIKPKGMCKKDYEKAMSVALGEYFTMNEPPPPPPTIDQQRADHRKRLSISANEKLRFPDKYHIYTAPVGRYGPEMYNAKLIRTWHETNTLESLDLRLYESDSMPHYYAVYARYPKSQLDKRGVSWYGRKETSGTKKEGQGYILEPIGSDWKTAKKMWDKEFKRLTGWEWEDRYQALGDWPEDLRAQKDGEKPFKWGQAQFRY